MRDFFIDNIGGGDDLILWRYQGSDEVVRIPDGVTEISSETFKNQKTIVSIELPSSIRYIGASAFSNCKKLETVIARNENPISICSNAFSKCSQLTSFETTGGVSSLGKEAFAGCTSLVKSPFLSEYLTKIERKAFFQCSSLTKIELPDRIQEIEAEAFAECVSLKELTIPNCFTRIGKKAFFGCMELEQVTFLNNHMSNIAPDAFEGCCALAQIPVSESEGYSLEEALFRCVVCSGYMNIDMATVHIDDFDYDRIDFSDCNNSYSIRTWDYRKYKTKTHVWYTVYRLENSCGTTLYDGEDDYSFAKKDIVQ